MTPCQNGKMLRCPACPICGMELEPCINQGVLIGWRCELCKKAITIERTTYEKAQAYQGPGKRGFGTK